MGFGWNDSSEPRKEYSIVKESVFNAFGRSGPFRAICQAELPVFAEELVAILGGLSIAVEVAFLPLSLSVDGDEALFQTWLTEASTR